MAGRDRQPGVTFILELVEQTVQPPFNKKKKKN